jgi:hypothetical protein
VSDGSISLTLGGLFQSAKLQKEHSIGHSKNRRKFYSLRDSCWPVRRRHIGHSDIHIQGSLGTVLAAISPQFRTIDLSVILTFRRTHFLANHWERFMKKLILCFLVVLISSVYTSAADDEHEEERVKDAGVVLKEILNIPDDIPQDLLDKAECVIILPSVKKAAFGVGASYGRGVMVCPVANTTKVSGALPRCMRSKVPASDFRLAARQRILFCW